jgi:hypothetical protein
MAANLQVVGKEELGFDDFWKAYPRKQARKDALKAWQRIDPDEYPKILRAIAQARRSDQWLKDNGQYVPMPATYLRGERWTDEMEIETEQVTPAGQIKDSQCQHRENGVRCKTGVTFWNVHGTKGNCHEHGPY